MTLTELENTSKRFVHKFNFIETLMDIYGAISYDNAQLVYKSVYGRNLFTKQFTTALIEEVSDTVDEYIRSECFSMEAYHSFCADKGRRIIYLSFLDDLHFIEESHLAYPLYVPTKDDPVFRIKKHTGWPMLKKYYNPEAYELAEFYKSRLGFSSKEAADSIRSHITLIQCSADTVQFRELLEWMEECLMLDGKISEPLPYRDEHIDLLKAFWNNFRLRQYNGHTPSEVGMEIL